MMGSALLYFNFDTASPKTIEPIGLFPSSTGMATCTSCCPVDSSIATGPIHVFPLMGIRCLSLSECDHQVGFARNATLVPSAPETKHSLTESSLRVLSWTASGFLVNERTAGSITESDFHFSLLIPFASAGGLAL